jgi:hypothetical protein
MTTCGEGQVVCLRRLTISSSTVFRAPESVMAPTLPLASWKRCRGYVA